MNTINNYTQQKVNTSFKGTLHFSPGANRMFYTRINRLPEKIKLKVLDNYDTFLQKIYKSNFDMKVNAIHKNKEMYVAVFKNGEFLTSASSKQTILDNIGLTNPVRFLRTAFKKATRS